MTKVLLVYATKEGHTERIAKAICQQMSKNGLHVDIYDAKEVASLPINFADFENLVFGGSIHQGFLEPELVEFFENHGASIPKDKAHLFITCLSAAYKDRDRQHKGEDEILDNLKKIPVHFCTIQFFGGALKYSKYNWFLRFFMKKIATDAGEKTETDKDYDFTDWDAVRDYANLF